VRTSSCAALNKVTILMNVEAVLISRGQSGKVSSNLSGRKHGCLFEIDDATTDLTGLEVEDTDGTSNLLCIVRVGRSLLSLVHICACNEHTRESCGRHY
jgi:hypothetical protein